MRALRVVLLDVNETLVDLAPLEAQFERVGLPVASMRTWFAATLRDGFALTVVGEFVTFRDLAIANLRSMLRSEAVDETEAEAVVDSISDLPLHADVADGLRALRSAGVRIATMTNGTSDVTETVLARAGVLSLVDHCLDVSGPQRWKPAAQAYKFAVTTMGVAPADAGLVAVHPWDVHGARRAGLLGIWLNRGDGLWPQPLAEPDLTVSDLGELAGLLSTTSG